MSLAEHMQSRFCFVAEEVRIFENANKRHDIKLRLDGKILKAFRNHAYIVQLPRSLTRDASTSVRALKSENGCPCLTEIARYRTASGSDLEHRRAWDQMRGKRSQQIGPLG